MRILVTLAALSFFASCAAQPVCMTDNSTNSRIASKAECENGTPGYRWVGG